MPTTLQSLEWHACPIDHKLIKQAKCKACSESGKMHTSPIKGFDVVCNKSASPETADNFCAGCGLRHSFLPMEGFCQECMDKEKEQMYKEEVSDADNI